MFDSPVYKQVQASDHADGATVPVVDRAAPVSEMQPLHDSVAIEPVTAELVSGESDPQIEEPTTDSSHPIDELARDSGEDRIEASLFRLRSSIAHLRQSSTLLHELRETVTATMNAIQSSQQRIAMSDRVIARAQTLDCEEAASAEGD